MVRAECDVALVQNATRRTATEQKQSWIRKVAALARACEKGRALAVARNAQSRMFKRSRVYPTDPEPPAPAQTCVSNLFLSEVAEHIPTALRKIANTQRTWTAWNAR